MDNDLVFDTDLTSYPGYPFPAEVVDAAVAAVRAEVGWHIAPERTETVVVDSAGEFVLLLPTMKLGAVTQVRDLSGTAPAVLTDYRQSAAGMLYRSLRWPLAFAGVEVTFTHGYAFTPADVVAAVAERCQRSLVNSAHSSMTVGSVSYTMRDGATATNTSPLLDPYRLR